jgi:hypothetical protein
MVKDMKKQTKKFEDDDGRVICSMDVDGMRRHDKPARQPNTATPKIPQSYQMTRSESRRFTWNALLAGLLIASVFSVVWVLFVLFCTEIWFR